MANKAIQDFLKKKTGSSGGGANTINSFLEKRGLNNNRNNQLILPSMSGGDPDTLKLTEKEMNQFLIDQWKEAKKDKKEGNKELKKEKDASKYSIATSDSTQISGKDISTLLKEVEAAEKLTGKEYIPKKEEKKEVPDEAKKRDKWMKTIIELQDKMNKTAIDTAGDTTYAMPQNIFNMAKGQQAALSDSINFSYGREAIRSPENWKRFIEDNPEPDTGKTIDQLSQDKYFEILEEIKKGDNTTGVIRPEAYEEEAEIRTQRWLEIYLKDKYNVDYNAATNK